MNLSKAMFAKHSKYRTTKISNEVRKYILAQEVEHRRKYFALVEYQKYGKIISEVLAVNNRTNDIEVALRIVEGCLPLVSPNLLSNWGAGYTYIFKDNKGYYEHEENILKEIQPNKTQIFIPSIASQVYLDLTDWSKDDQLQYLDKYKEEVKENCTYLSEFVTYLRQAPKIELLVKAGIGQYFKEFRNLKNYKLTPAKVETMKRYNLNIKQLKHIERNHIAPENYQFMYQFKKLFYTRYDYRTHLTLNPLELIDPLLERNVIKIKHLYEKYNNLYVDTLQIAYKLIKCGINIKFEDYLLYDGKDMLVSHNNLFEMLELAEANYEELKAEAERKKQQEYIELNRKKDIALKKISNKYNKLINNDNDINFNVLGSLEDYLITGETLHHCVYSMHYYDKVIDKKALIINALVNNEITETLEINLKDKSIVQCRGKYNSDSKYHEAILKQAEERILSVI